MPSKRARKVNAVPPSSSTARRNSSSQREPPLTISNNYSQLEAQLAEGQPSILSHIKATCRQGTERAGHGLVLTIDAQYSTHSGQSFYNGQIINLSTDIHGSNVFSSLPSGLGMLAQSMLPQDVNAHVVSDDSRASRHVTLEIGVGLTKLSRGRIDQVLESIIGEGDEPFVLEFRSQTGALMGFLPTKASLVKASLDGGCDVVHNGVLPIYKPKGKAFQYVNLLKCMIFFAIATWYLYLYPTGVFSGVPRVLSMESYNPSTVVDLLPLHPTNMSAAFRMGSVLEQVNQEYNMAETMNMPVNYSAVQLLLQQAGTLGGKSDAENVTEDQLRNALLEIVRVESQVSIISKVRGFFSFINCIWLFSIFGICISIGPTLYTLLHPLQDLIVRVSKYIAHEILFPIAIRLHSWGIFEMLIYSLCWIFIVEGYRLGEDAGVMVAVTGHILSALCVFYSCFLWGKRILHKWNKYNLMQYLHLWLIITWIPSAIHLQSTLLGYGVTFAFFCIMGLDARITPLLIQVGFHNESNALRCTMASFGLIFVQTFLRATEVDSHLLNPFNSAVGVVGNNTFFLSILILSFSSSQHKSFFSVALAICLILFNFVGNVLSIPGMSTVAVTYAVLAALMKYGEFHMKNRYNKWLLMLIMSVLIWRISLFLNLNPIYITCLFGT